MNFEQSIKRLREICDKLKDENISLEEAMSLYKEGTKLADECTAVLETVKSELNITYEQTN